MITATQSTIIVIEMGPKPGTLALPCVWGGRGTWCEVCDRDCAGAQTSGTLNLCCVIKYKVSSSAKETQHFEGHTNY